MKVKRISCGNGCCKKFKHLRLKEIIYSRKLAFLPKLEHRKICLDSMQQIWPELSEQYSSVGTVEAA